MDFDETMVEEEFDEAVEDDTSLDDFVEEDESDEDEEFPDEELELPDEETEDYEEEEPEPEPEPRKEPGYVKQRVQQAVDRAIRETEARMQARFDEQLAPLLEKMAEDEAQELLRSRKVNDIETARELVRLRRGQGTAEKVTQPTQPRNEQGQFVSKEQIATQARQETMIDILASQVDKITAEGGPDVMELFQNDPDIKKKVINGEMDFYDVAKMMSKPKRRTPSPTHSPNGANNYTTANAFANMSSKQFERMERKLEEGVRYTMR